MSFAYLTEIRLAGEGVDSTGLNAHRITLLRLAAIRTVSGTPRSHTVSNGSRSGRRCGSGIPGVGVAHLARGGRHRAAVGGSSGSRNRLAYAGEVCGGRRSTSQRLTIAGLHHVAKTAAYASLAGSVVAEEIDGHAGIHTAVDVLRQQLRVDVALGHHLRLVLRAGSDDPATLALGAVGSTVLTNAIAVVDGDRQSMFAFTAVSVFGMSSVTEYFGVAVGSLLFTRGATRFT